MNYKRKKSIPLRLLLFGCAFLAWTPAKAEQAVSLLADNYSLADLLDLAHKNAQILSAQDARADASRLAASQTRMWSGMTVGFSGGKKKVGGLSGSRSEWTFDQPLPLLGKPGVQGNIFEIESESWRGRREATRIAIAFDVLRFAYDYAVNRRKTDFAENRQRRFDLIQDFLSGRSFPTPQRKAESRIVQNRLKGLAAEAIQSQARAGSALENLRIFIPFAAGARPVIDLPWFTGKKPLDPMEWTAKASDKNPDLHLQRLAVKSADLEGKLASKEGWPDPGLAASFEEAKAGETEKIYGLGMTLAFPSWNANRSGYRSAESKKRAEEMQLAFQEQKLKADIQRLLVEYEAARRIVLEYPEAVLSEMETQIQEAEAGFRKGQLDLLTFLELDGSVSDTFNRVLDAQADFAARVADLLAATGESDVLEKLGSF